VDNAQEGKAINGLGRSGNSFSHSINRNYPTASLVSNSALRKRTKNRKQSKTRLWTSRSKIRRLTWLMPSVC
jgi:hypothetical protein